MSPADWNLSYIPMNRGENLRSTLKIGAIAAVLGLSLTSQATAASENSGLRPMSHSQCDAAVNVVCGWSGTGYSDNTYAWRYSTGNTGGPVRSIWNKRGSWVVVYSGTNYTGDRYTVNAGASVPVLPFPAHSIATSG
ncbi:peptidase inhibitor family I36 protein [Actinosynnema sp. ALI-1.44]|uniref:peptidase inhibitor family I36 protein n=1 Tax=Actinosynnema sp. ALI-1.44 TaxID=1933779 RepID=UPI00097C72EB|nr:peptidase inhibitor family I36 protein [Actinosynnema sp. ALI-1.44]